MEHQILRRLRQDHRQLESLLLVLEHQFECIKQPDRPDYDLMYQILHYLTDYPDQYHHVLEDLLFERLAWRRADSRPIFDTLHEQHNTLTCQGARLRMMINNVLDGLSLSREHLGQSGLDYIREYRQHLNHEETEVFELVNDSLTSADWVTLTTALVWHIDPLFSEKVDTAYRYLYEQLCRLGIDFQQLRQGQHVRCPACSSTDTDGVDQNAARPET